MKKLLLITAAAMAFSACEGPPGRPGESGLNGRDGVVRKIDKIITISPNHWEAYPSINPDEFMFWEYAWLIDEFDRYVFEDGIYMTYHQWETDNGVIVRDPLTVVNFFEDNYYWTETMACDYSEGEVRLYLKPSDFDTVPPGVKLTFRFIAIW